MERNRSLASVAAVGGQARRGDDDEDEPLPLFTDVWGRLMHTEDSFRVSFGHPVRPSKMELPLSLSVSLHKNFPRRPSVIVGRRSPAVPTRQHYQGNSQNKKKEKDSSHLFPHFH